MGLSHFVQKRTKGHVPCESYNQNPIWSMDTYRIIFNFQNVEPIEVFSKKHEIMIFSWQQSGIKTLALWTVVQVWDPDDSWLERTHVNISSTYPHVSQQ